MAFLCDKALAFTSNDIFEHGTIQPSIEMFLLLISLSNQGIFSSLFQQHKLRQKICGLFSPKISSAMKILLFFSILFFGVFVPPGNMNIIARGVSTK